MKRLVSALLILAMIVCAVPALAENWFCTNCGQQNDSNFCGNCGTARPKTQTAQIKQNSSFSVQDVVLEADGSVTVYWAGGEAPYEVHYQFYVNKDYNTGADVIQWEAPDSYYGTSINLTDCFVPGERYWVKVVDSQGSEAWYDFNTRVSTFNEVRDMRLAYSLRAKRNNRATTVSSHSASEIEKNRVSNVYGATVKINTPHLSQDYYYNIRMAMVLPSGEPVLFHLSYEEFDQRYRYVYWETYDFAWLWDILVEEKGKIPTGQYTFKIYADDQILGLAQMQMNR